MNNPFQTTSLDPGIDQENNGVGLSQKHFIHQEQLVYTPVVSTSYLLSLFVCALGIKIS